MPLHTLGADIPNSRWGITRGDCFSLLTALLFYWQPGVDPRAVMQWIIDNGFMGSIAACSIFGTFVSHKLLEWGVMAFYTVLYYIDTWFPNERMKNARLEATPWPWGEKHSALERKSIWYILKFHGAVSVLQFLIFTSAIHWNWSKGGLQWDWIQGHPDLAIADPATIPDKLTVAYQCLVSTFVTETGFYFMHRLMHETRLYYWHKRHHEYKDATVYATFYVGVFDSLVTDLIPAGFGIIYFKMHLWTIWLFTLPIILNALRVHCGFDNARLFPLGFDPSVSLPLCTDTERTHDMHHRLNMGNYGGAYFFWDRICGTWMCPDKELEAIKNGKSFKPFPKVPHSAVSDPGVAPKLD